jgi:hypothetical protein
MSNRIYNICSSILYLYVLAVCCMNLTFISSLTHTSSEFQIVNFEFLSSFIFSVFFGVVVQTGVRGAARGSSYIEMGTTKVMCIVNGPKDLSKKIDFR